MEKQKGLPEELQLHLDGKCNPNCVVQGKNYRFTVLTEEMVRMEYSESGIFEDKPTQIVWNRYFPKPEFDVIDKDNRLEIITKSFHLVYNKQRFNAQNLYIDLKHNYTNYGGRWYFGTTTYGNPPREHNLKGTARTLDRANGSVKLENGLIDRSGRTFFDDSDSRIINIEGWPEERTQKELDFYYLGYGHNYYKAIHDFYLLSGNVPMLPRYALGNWWSRYWDYTEESYKELMNRFEQEKIPFSVAVLDMDWHITDVPEKYGRGWTGYTWNKEFFPDPERFLKWLHDKGCKVTLNLHPADGVMPYEDAYKDMADELGIDKNLDIPIQFDITDKKFLNAYFKYLHHPLEKQGVDFWWIDWQQGTVSSLGLDPLRLLNHFHFLDIQRNNNKRGLIFSRYGGLGSHRYPVGFSGDSIISWDSLDFQPYFTSTASNIGYTWWSHDIGGHVSGQRDNENMVRWVQFGVFSPINRLHSSKNKFLDKAPWSYPLPYNKCLTDILRLRHQLVPYIYTMNKRVSQELIPFIVPMYYDYPDDARAYNVRNQYMFGSQIMVAPITKHTDPETMLADVDVFIPQGTWIDFFDGTVYHGGFSGRSLRVHRTIDRMPAFCKSGAIVPLDRTCNNNVEKNPEELDLLLFAGDNGSFILYEDGGDGFDYKQGKVAQTEISLTHKDDIVCCKIHSTGDFTVIPERRSYKLVIRGVDDGVFIDQSTVDVVNSGYDNETHSYYALLKPVEPTKDIEVIFRGVSTYSAKDLNDVVFECLQRMQIDNEEKKTLFNAFEKQPDPLKFAGDILTFNIPQNAKNAIIELLTR